MCLILMCLFLTASKTNAQFILKEADQQFELYNYAKAIELYTEAYQQKKSLKTTTRLAQCYRFVKDYKQAESWSAILIKTPGAKPEAYLWYAEALRANAKYTEAKLAYASYANLANNLTAAQIQQLDTWQLSCDSAIKWMKSPKPITIVNENDLNTPQSDFGVTNYNNTIVFSSDRPSEIEHKENKPFFKFNGPKLPNKQVYGWTGNAYLQLYQKDATGKVAPFNINTKFDYHISSPVFNADGTEMYFAATPVPAQIAREKRAPSTINIQIFSLKKINGTWSEPIAFIYNKPQKWSVSDPFLSNDGNTLYFVSNMPGGKGGADIYFCNRKTDGTWGDAINFEVINTPGNERNFVADEKYFYFSSDGLVGMGELDIYRVRRKANGLGKIENLGFPINSPQDDFAFSFTSTTKRYLASNREGGIGNDDIYSYIDLDKITIPFVGQILNKETNQPLRNAVLSLTKVNGVTVKVQTDELGKYKLNLDEDADYTVSVDKTNYRSATNKFTTRGLDSDEPFKLNLYLDTIIIDKPIVLENIYYDFNSSRIRPDAAKELDKLALIMKENPTIWVVLSSHSDQRGSDKYNLWLSERRAVAAVNYIIARGIAKNRISAKGYGETKPNVNCKTCSPADYKLNRRTEFKIVKQ